MTPAFALAAALSSRNITFQVCNDTIDPAFFAVAYETPNRSRTAEGWTKVDPGRCGAQDNVRLPRDGWFSYYVFTQSGRNYRAGPGDLGESICARPDDFSLEKAAQTDRLDSGCPAGYDLLHFRRVDAADATRATYTIRLETHGVKTPISLRS